MITKESLTDNGILAWLGTQTWSHASAVVLLLLLAGASPLLHGKSRPASEREAEALPSQGTGIAYVSTNGSDSNDGLSWGAAKATIAGALAALPKCTVRGVKGGSATAACGTIKLAGGTYQLSSGITLTSPLVSLRGDGGGLATQINYTGKGCAITLDYGSGTAVNQYMPGVISGLSINGAGDVNTNACGMSSTNLSEVTIRDIQIGNFAREGDACFISASGRTFNERNNIGPMWIGNCTTEWLLTSAGSSVPYATLGYGKYNIYINVMSHQTGIASVGTSTHPIIMTNGSFHIIENMNAQAEPVCMRMVHSEWASNSGTWECEGGKDASGWVLDATSSFTFNGAFWNQVGHNTIPPGANVWVSAIGIPGTNFPFEIQRNSGSLFFRPSTSGSYVYDWPPFGGTVALSGANGISAGKITLHDGMGSHRFSRAYSAAPVCIASDTTGSATVKVTSNAGSIAVYGRGDDVVAWACMPAEN